MNDQDIEFRLKTIEQDKELFNLYKQNLEAELQLSLYESRSKRKALRDSQGKKKGKDTETKTMTAEPF